MSLKQLTEHRLEFLSLKGGCTGSSESTLVYMPHCRKSHVATHLALTLKAPITTAADDDFCDIFLKFRKKGTIFR